MWCQTANIFDQKDLLCNNIGFGVVLCGFFVLFCFGIRDLSPCFCSLFNIMIHNSLACLRKKKYLQKMWAPS